ncbi:unnamed protein product, partial [Rotaria magnacalcarata]
AQSVTNLVRIYAEATATSQQQQQQQQKRRSESIASTGRSESIASTGRSDELTKIFEQATHLSQHRTSSASTSKRPS